MRKLIYAINVTIDGFADHTAVIADDELHNFYTNLLSSVDTLLFGRKTYQLMESFWPTAHEDPRSTKSMIDFANQIDSMQKIVFSKTLEKVEWNKTRLVKGDLIEEVKKLKQSRSDRNKCLSIGGISAASSLMKEGLIDEYWFLVQPIILGNGRQLFERLNDRKDIKLVDIQKLNSGVVVMHYQKI